MDTGTTSPTPGPVEQHRRPKGGGHRQNRPVKRHFQVVETKHLHGGTAARRDDVPRLPPARLPPVSENPPALLAILFAALVGFVACLILFLWYIFP